MAKMRTFESFWGCIPTFLPDKRAGPLPRAKFHVYRGNVSKPIFGPLSKCSTGMAASKNAIRDSRKVIA